MFHVCTVWNRTTSPGGRSDVSSDCAESDSGPVAHRANIGFPNFVDSRKASRDDGIDSNVTRGKGIRVHQGRCGKGVLFSPQRRVWRRPRESERGRRGGIRPWRRAEGSPGRERQAHNDLIGLAAAYGMTLCGTTLTAKEGGHKRLQIV